ncbi:MAG: ATP--guanido phosphotransferase [Planctomycetota bacterium]
MAPIPLEPQRWAARVGAWLLPGGPEGDVVVSCRARLARNLAEFPFVTRLDAKRAEELATRAKDALDEAKLDGETIWVAMTEAPPMLRLLLRERHLVSRDLVPSEDGTKAAPGRAVAFGASECVSVMVNEEDHLRLQTMTAGYAIRTAWERARELDRFLEARLPYAVDGEFGYLTGCPTNVGTGLRASVMLHLPALGLVRSELEKVFAAAQRTGLAVRGQYGEGSRAAGDLYQISNQITLGRGEEDLVRDLEALVPRILEFERRVRELLLREQRAALVDRIARSIGLLRTARSMPTEAALAHLSNVRLGLHLGLVREPSLEVLAPLSVQVQRAHVQALAQEPLEAELCEASVRDTLRASWLRRRLATA